VRLIEHLGQKYAQYHWSGDSPSIYALHGFMGSGRDFALLAQNLSVELWAWDLIGHGKSSVPLEERWYSLAGQLQFLKDTIPRDSILLGYSMGGRLALQFACRHPQHIKGIVIVGGTPGIVGDQARQDRHRWDHQMASQIRANGMSAFVEYWNKLPIIQSQQNIASEHRQVMLDIRREHSEIGIANSIEYFGTGQMPHCWAELATMDVPILLLVGEQDQKYIDIALQMFDVITNASLAVIPAAGHCAHLENPYSTATIIERWLRDIPYSSSGASGQEPAS